MRPSLSSGEPGQFARPEGLDEGGERGGQRQEREGNQRLHIQPRLHITDHGIVGRDPLDETLFQVLAGGMNETIEGVRVGRVRDDLRLIMTLGDPMAGIPC
jgi:hypothetical protein